MSEWVEVTAEEMRAEVVWLTPPDELKTWGKYPDFAYQGNAIYHGWLYADRRQGAPRWLVDDSSFNTRYYARAKAKARCTCGTWVCGGVHAVAERGHAGCDAYPGLVQGEPWASAVRP